MSDEARFKVIFRLQQDKNGYPPVGLEGIWAERLADGKFRVDNIPFHTYEAACDDVISAEERDGRLFFTSLVQPSGNTLLRVIAYNPSTVPEIRSALNALGCQSEATGSLVAVNVPKDVDYAPVFGFLKRGMDDNRWGFEEAVLCHTDP